ncbi:hypothetical protein [Agromyces larvae]|uniref:Minor tail protein n=1 Tax=Agromyces larvae TaxID=2929802 RepID=A0ABY4C5L2_9MICO|nr:hypothetical protein [Agromyces larvae]UOE45466.1 hypothetical protein MTO99_06835 [Agromyces larvae]
MVSDEQRIFELAQGRSDTTEGLCIRMDWDARLAEVDVNGVTMKIPVSGPPPWPGDRVRIITAGLKPVCALIMGAPMGTVQTTGSGIATVEGDDHVVYRYPFLGSAPANAARVRLDHAGRVVHAGGYSVEPEGSEYVRPAPPPTPAGGAAWFGPAWSGNWRYGGFAGDAAQISDSRTAAYGYGTSIADTIPDGASVTRAELHLVQNWDNVPGVASSMGLHGFNGRPGSMSNANLGGVFSVPGGSRAVDIRGGIADALKVGSALGVGFRSGATGWREYAAAPASGRIYMEWS